MNTVRRATPDSEALASSEDERPWPSSTTFGTLPRKDTDVPGLPGGIWSATKRGSFKMGEAAKRNIARDVRLGGPNQVQSLIGLRAGNTPSPAQSSEGVNQLPFSIPLQSKPKVMRSLSHSQGQQEMMQAPAGTQPGAVDHALPLGLLAEEDADVDEIDSDFGVQLTHTTSHPPIGSLQRTATMPTSYESAVHSYRNNRYDSGDFSAVSPPGRRGNDSAFATGFAVEQPHRRAAQWQSHLGWDDLPPMPNESRRHSLAEIPTRRGSLDLDDPTDALASLRQGLQSQSDRRWDSGNQGRPEMFRRLPGGPSDTSPTIALALAQHSNHATHINTTGEMKFNEDPLGVNFNLPPTYKVPYVELGDDASVGRHQTRDNRPRKILYIVSFKCSRVDVFYILEHTGLDVHAGDIVIVEADRGQDLGTVQHVDVTTEQAKLYKKKYSEEQYKWLMMFSRNNTQGNVNPNAPQNFAESNRNPMLANAPATVAGMTRESSSLKPKAIKRLASEHEVRMLADKEGNEAKAKRTCQQKVAHLHLEMEILDAEFQWDFQKVIFYYYADKYINFKDLITELYRIYKSRIWLSAVNPASFSQHAMGQPPSGIGPGAITMGDHAFNPLTYGPVDPDPHGAIPPYEIEAYTPNYPGIPGVINSFAPQNRAQNENMPSSMFPATAPNVAPNQHGNIANYEFYYLRPGANEQSASHASQQNASHANQQNASHANQQNAFHNRQFDPFQHNGMMGDPYAYHNYQRGYGGGERSTGHYQNAQFPFRQHNGPPGPPFYSQQAQNWYMPPHRPRALLPRDPAVEAQVFENLRNLSVGNKGKRVARPDDASREQ